MAWVDSLDTLWSFYTYTKNTGIFLFDTTIDIACTGLKFGGGIACAFGGGVMRASFALNNNYGIKGVGLVEGDASANLVAKVFGFQLNETQTYSGSYQRNLEVNRNTNTLVTAENLSYWGMGFVIIGTTMQVIGNNLEKYQQGRDETRYLDQSLSKYKRIINSKTTIRSIGDSLTLSCGGFFATGVFLRLYKTYYSEVTTSYPEQGPVLNNITVNSEVFPFKEDYKANYTIRFPTGLPQYVLVNLTEVAPRFTYYNMTFTPPFNLKNFIFNFTTNLPESYDIVVNVFSSIKGQVNATYGGLLFFKPNYAPTDFDAVTGVVSAIGLFGGHSTSRIERIGHLTEVKEELKPILPL